MSTAHREPTAGGAKTVVRDGDLERGRFDGGFEHVRLVVCPACGHEFAQRELRARHIAEHAPEDFGLAPLGRRP